MIRKDGRRLVFDEGPCAPPHQVEVWQAASWEAHGAGPPTIPGQLVLPLDEEDPRTKAREATRRWRQKQREERP